MNHTIRLERVFNAPVSTVWKALTEKNLMKLWYFDLAEFKPEVGFEFRFYGGPEDGIQYLHVCQVTEEVFENKLVYSWRYEGYAGISYLSFELISQGENTLLKLTHEGLDSFPQDNPDFAIGNFAEGWNQIINFYLKDFLEKEPS